MKNKFEDIDLMKFADKETSGEKAMDILIALLQNDDEAKVLAKRISVFTSTRNALLNNVIGDKHERT